MNDDDELDVKLFTMEFDEPVRGKDCSFYEQSKANLCEIEREERAVLSATPERRVMFQDKLKVSAQKLMVDLDQLGFDNYARQRPQGKRKVSPPTKAETLLRAVNTTVDHAHFGAWFRPDCYALHKLP